MLHISSKTELFFLNDKERHDVGLNEQNHIRII